MVAEGRGQFRNGEAVHRFGPGDVLFVPAGVVHRFEEFSDDLVVWVFFYGPEGGEVEAVSVELRTGGGLERTLPREAYLVARVCSRGRRSGSSAASGSASAARRSSPRRATTSVKDVARREHPARPDARRRARGRTTTSAATAARSSCPTAAPARFAGGIRCPYHSWTYTLDGELRTAPFLEEIRRARPERAVAPSGGRRHLGRLRLRAAHAGRGGGAGHTLAAQLGARAGAAPALSARRASRRRGRITYEVAGQLEGDARELQRVLPLRAGAPGALPAGPRVQAARRLRARLGARAFPHREGAWTFTASGTTNRAAVRGARRRRADPPQGRADLSQLPAEPERRARGGVPGLSARARPHHDRQRVPVPSRRDGEGRTSIRRTRWSSGTW